MASLHRHMLPTDVLHWTASDVASFIRSLGKGSRWGIYARNCMERGVDGAVVAQANIDDLVGLGFHKIHANRVYCVLKGIKGVKILGSNQLSMPFSEGERSQVARFEEYCDMLDTSERKIESVMENLASEVGSMLQISTSSYDQMLKWIRREREQAQTQFECKYKKMMKTLTLALDKIRSRKETMTKDFRRLRNLAESSDWTDTKTRMAHINAIVNKSLKENVALLVLKPSVKMKFNKSALSALIESSVDIQYTEPHFDVKKISDLHIYNRENIKPGTPNPSRNLQWKSKPSLQRRNTVPI